MEGDTSVSLIVLTTRWAVYQGPLQVDPFPAPIQGNDGDVEEDVSPWLETTFEVVENNFFHGLLGLVH